MKHTISIILLIVLGFFSCKKEENKEVVFAQHDIVDTVRNVTIHVMPQDLLESQSDSVQAYYRKFKNYKYTAITQNYYNLHKVDHTDFKKKTIQKEELLPYDVLLTETFEKLAT